MQLVERVARTWTSCIAALPIHPHSQEGDGDLPGWVGHWRGRVEGRQRLASATKSPATLPVPFVAKTNCLLANLSLPAFILGKGFLHELDFLLVVGIKPFQQTEQVATDTSKRVAVGC
jgi:hypothetical protein